MAGGRKQGGRPWGPIRADSTEGEALARFLRAQVDASGKTLSDLASDIHVSRTQIGANLGGRVPEQRFVESLLSATVPEPRLRERRTAEAMKLLHAAKNPAPSKPPPARDSGAQLAEARAQQLEVYDRLTRSLEQQNQLRETAGNSVKLVMVLGAIISELERRVSDLTEERDQLRAHHAEPEALQQTQQQLTRAREQEERAHQELQRAQEKQRQAEDLAARVQARLDQLSDELDRLRPGATDDQDDAALTGDTPEDAHVAASADEIGDDIDQALNHAAAVNDQDDQALRRITHDMDQDSDTDGPAPDNPPDNQTTSSVTPDNLTAILPVPDPDTRGVSYGRHIGRPARRDYQSAVMPLDAARGNAVSGVSVVMRALLARRESEERTTAVATVGAFRALLRGCYGTTLTVAGLLLAAFSTSAFTRLKEGATPNPNADSPLSYLVFMAVFAGMFALTGTLASSTDTAVGKAFTVLAVVLCCATPVVFAIGLIDPNLLGPVGAWGRSWAESDGPTSRVTCAVGICWSS
ncbi:hypothetical protein GCM10010271_55130 [Streptomyces kurssanovii]|nr:hypothetical protein GCM10010271_55130 [Streptomyces kurssanovii]